MPTYVGRIPWLVPVKWEDGWPVLGVDGKAPDELERLFVRADCDFVHRSDTARFYYSLDGKDWTSIGEPLKMTYSLSHFKGDRFGLFNYSSREPGGSVDFAWFHLSEAPPHDIPRLPHLFPPSRGFATDFHKGTDFTRWELTLSQRSPQTALIRKSCSMTSYPGSLLKNTRIQHQSSIREFASRGSSESRAAG